jgi:aminoglycoside 3-N-acetyltransferase
MRATLAEDDVVAAFRACGVGAGDTLMLHSDAMVAAQFGAMPADRRLDLLIDGVLRVIGPAGTLVVPTFTYSFTRGEVFDPDGSASAVGSVTEHFRRRAGVLRSRDPLFSVAAAGRLAPLFAAADPENCFGPRSAFALLHGERGKIACLGCALDRATFVHYVEQCARVAYRYPKRFAGVIRRAGEDAPAAVTYLVRDLSRRSETDLTRLKARLIEQGKLRRQELGRVGLLVVRAEDFFSAATALLAEDPLALIREGARAA